MRKHVHVVDVATRACRQVTDGDWHAGDPAWSPDGTRLAFAAGTAPDADLTYRAPVYVIDAADERARPAQVGLADGLGGPLVWTADCTALLVVGTPGAPTGHAGLLRVPVDAPGEVLDLASPLDRNVMPGGPAYPGAVPQLVDDGRTVLFCARDRGCTHLYAVGVAGNDSPRLVVGGESTNVSGLSVAAGRAAIVLGTATSFGEIVLIELATGQQDVRTKHGETLADVELFARVEREFTISDGTRVHGWLIRDPQAATPQPLLLDIHGGPHNAWNGAADEIHLYHQELAARGWAVLLSTRAAPTATARRSTPPRSAHGAPRTRPTCSSRWTSWSRRDSPTRSGWPSPDTATAAT
jgi:dipeptidyl aminopeptidase/acylaminoacyl peptidase